MTSSIASITFDCEHAGRLAQFWSAVLDRPIDEGDPATAEFFSSVGRSAGDGGAMMMFIKVPEGKTVKNRVHLDLATSDRPAEVQRLLDLGATHVHDKDEWGVSWTTLRDPEGNEFCLAESHDISSE